MTDNKRAIVLSYSGVLAHLFHERISIVEIQDALFYFGCVRSHIFTPGCFGEPNELDWIARKDPKRGRAVHAQFLEVLESAENEMRVMWRQLDESCEYISLNRLLFYFDLPALAPIGAMAEIGIINFPELERYQREHNPPYQFIY